MFSSPMRSAIHPTITMAMERVINEIIMKRPLAADGFPMDCSWMMASITGVVERMLNPVRQRNMALTAPVVVMNRKRLAGASRTATQRIFFSSQGVT